MSRVKFGDLYLGYDELMPSQPEGSVLLMTGLGANRSAWLGHLSLFGKHYRTVALDHRDAGDSDPSPIPYTTIDQAQDAAGVIQALGLGRTHVVGLSMGGFVAMELALNYPELVRSLILICTKLSGPEAIPATPEAAVALERFPAMNPVEYNEKTYPLLVAPDYFERNPGRLQRLAEAAAKTMMLDDAYQRQRATEDSRSTHQRIHQITAPTLVIHGEEDRLVPVENGILLAKKIPSAKLIIYPDCGHLVTMEKSREFGRDALAFFQEQ